MAKTRLEKLKELEKSLYALMQDAKEGNMASLVKQYRETLREIEELENGSEEGDEISEILNEREADGKSGAVRKDRSKKQ